MGEPWEQVLSLEEITDIKSLSLRLRLGDDLLMNPDRTALISYAVDNLRRKLRKTIQTKFPEFDIRPECIWQGEYRDESSGDLWVEVYWEPASECIISLKTEPPLTRTKIPMVDGNPPPTYTFTKDPVLVEEDRPGDFGIQIEKVEVKLVGYSSFHNAWVYEREDDNA